MYKVNFSKYLEPDKRKNNPKKVLKDIWKWTKAFFLLFLTITMLWGCVQTMMPKYVTSTITDMAGEKVFSAGVGFEIVIRSLNDFGYKTHWVIINGNNMEEYDYNLIYSWSQAFTKTSSPFFGLFVYPTSYILTAFIKGISGTNLQGNLDSSMTNYGLASIFAILFTSIIMKTIALGFTWKSQKNQEKMQSMQGKQAEIQAKYAGRKDPATKQRQQMELMELYKKEGISPMSAIVAMFSSMPFLLAIYASVRADHALKVATAGSISLIERPWSQVTSGHFVYLSLFFTYVPLQAMTVFLPTILVAVKERGKLKTEQQRKARKKQLIIQSVMVVVFMVVVSQIAAGVVIYWIFSSTYQIIQTLGFHFARELKASRIRNRNSRNKRKAYKIEQKRITGIKNSKSSDKS